MEIVRNGSILGLQSATGTMSVSRNTEDNVQSSINEYFSLTKNPYKQRYLDNFVNYANSFVGKVNDDRAGNFLFSEGKNRAWGNDFVKHCVIKTLGASIPEDFKTSVSPAPFTLKNWGIKHNCYYSIPEGNENVIKTFIKDRVKPGDIVIMKKDGKSANTAIVKNVESDGSYITVIMGNCNNKVREVKINPLHGDLDGFISMSKVIK